MIDPCGMVMDYLRMGIQGRALRSYYATARIRESPELLCTIRYYLAPPGARVFPAVHAFGCNVWERGDWDAPRSGLGVLDFDFSNTDRGIAPLGVTGQGTPTPLDWFLNGVPAGITGPWPNGQCTPAGEPMIVRFWGNPGLPTMQASLPTAGLTVMQYSIVACCNQWQVHLSSNDPAPGPGLTVQSFNEAFWPGYQPQSPGFSTTSQQADGSSVMSTGPIVWTRGSGGGPAVTVFWVYVTDRISGALITAGRFASPITVTNPGDQVQLQTLLVQLSSYQPVQAVWTGAVGLGLAAVAHGTGYPGTEGTFYVWASGFGVDSLGFDWTAANGPYALRANSFHTVWTSASFVVGGRSCSWSLTFNPVNLPVVSFNWVPHGSQASWPRFNTPWNLVSPLELDGNTGQPFPPAPAYFPIILFSDATEVDLPTIGSVVWDTGSGPVPPQHVLADGSAISRSTYAALFNYMGTTFGNGDGTTTFNVPDLRGRLPRGTSPGGLGSDRPSAVPLGATGGEETHTLVSGEIPAHNHGITDPGHTHGTQGPAGFFLQSGGGGSQEATTGLRPVDAQAATGSATTGISTNNTGGGGSHNTLPPNMGLRPLIFVGV